MPWEYGHPFYPDTVLPEKQLNPFQINKELHTITISEYEIFAKHPTDTISIFFFDPDTLANYDWATIRQEYKILVRYDLSRNDLAKLGWRFYYPPIEEMKDMKMYPPYDQ